MIVMIVAQQNRIDWREVLKAQAGRTVPPRTQPSNRAGAFRPDWIGEDIPSVHLDEHRGVINEGDAQATLADLKRRRRSRRSVGPRTPWTRFSMEHPAHDVPKSSFRDGIQVVEPPSIKMICSGATIPFHFTQ